MFIRLHAGKLDESNAMLLDGKQRPKFEVISSVDLFFANHAIYRLYRESDGIPVYIGFLSNEVVYKDELGQELIPVPTERVIEALNSISSQEARVALRAIADVVKKYGSASVLLFGMVTKK